MHIFIDESGIHKKVDHSSFALVYVEVNNFKLIEDKIFETSKSIGMKNEI